MFYAWTAGRAAELRSGQQVKLTAAAAVPGLLMIVLKDFILIRLR